MDWDFDDEPTDEEMLAARDFIAAVNAQAADERDNRAAWLIRDAYHDLRLAMIDAYADPF